MINIVNMKLLTTTICYYFFLKNTYNKIHAGCGWGVILDAICATSGDVRDVLEDPIATAGREAPGRATCT